MSEDKQSVTPPVQPPTFGNVSLIVCDGCGVHAPLYGVPGPRQLCRECMRTDELIDVGEFQPPTDRTESTNA